MAKLFVISDVHGFYDEMMEALNKAGFDPGNEDHWLISCGDHFDRGPKNKKVMDYLMALERKVLIRGNHEDLFEDLCRRRHSYGYDVTNGTYDAVCELGVYGYTDFIGACDLAMQTVRPFFDSMVDYFETENYIFVHSWIAIKNNDGLPFHYTRNRDFEFDPDWRNADALAWQDAKWGNPLDMAMKGLTPEKCVVAGHWHCSAGWAMEKGTNEFGKDSIFEPYYYEDKLIMIDACTAYSGKVNVLILEDNFL